MNVSWEEQLNWRIKELKCSFAECLVNPCVSGCVEVSCDYYSLSALAVLACLRLPETGELLLLLLAAILSEQQLWLEGGRSRPTICVVWRGRDHRWVAVGTRFDITFPKFNWEKNRKPVHFNTHSYSECVRAVELPIPV